MYHQLILQVSIIEYCKASDVKKGINEQFRDVYPFIKLTLTKLRRCDHIGKGGEGRGGYIYRGETL